jgi:CBS domain-containing protein
VPRSTRQPEKTGTRKGAARQRSVGELMRHEFVTVSTDESLLEALRIMQLARLRHLLVERNGALAGILSYRDLQNRTIEQLDLSSGPLETSMRALTVEEAMMESPYVVTPDTPSQEAASRLCHLGIGCLPVVEERPEGPRLVGIITEVDLLRAAYDTH